MNVSSSQDPMSPETEEEILDVDQNSMSQENDDDDYGGMDHDIYSEIVEFKRHGTYPPRADLKVNRNAHFHWRLRCQNFILSEPDTLLYVGSGASATRIVVKRGEVKTAIKIIHERSGHMGQKQTHAAVVRRLYWKNIRRDVTKYLNDCRLCQKKRELRRPSAVYTGVEQFLSKGQATQAEERRMAPEELAIADRLLLTASTEGQLRNLQMMKHHEAMAQEEMYAYMEDLDGYEQTAIHVLEELDDDEDDEFIIAADAVRMNVEELVEEESAPPPPPTKRFKVAVDEATSSSNQAQNTPASSSVTSSSSRHQPSTPTRMVTRGRAKGMHRESPSSTEKLTPESRRRASKKEDTSTVSTSGNSKNSTLMLENGGRRAAGAASSSGTPATAAPEYMIQGGAGGAQAGHYEYYHTAPPLQYQLATTSNGVGRRRGVNSQPTQAAIQADPYGDTFPFGPALTMPPVDPSIAALQRQVLLLQQEVLQMKKAWLKARLDAIYGQAVQVEDDEHIGVVAGHEEVVSQGEDLDVER